MRCYFIAMCMSSSIDRDSNSISLFNVVEEIAISQFEPRAVVQISAHIYFEAAPEDRGKLFETQSVWISETGTETVGEGTNTLPVAANARRIRTRSMFLRLPPELGAHSLTIAWREVGTLTWERTPLFWPLIVREGQAPEVAQ